MEIIFAILAAVAFVTLTGHGIWVLLAFIIFQGFARKAIALRMPGVKTERLFSIILGVIMTLVAEGGVLAIGLPVFNVYFNTAPPEDAVVVEVTGQQFAWNIR